MTPEDRARVGRAVEQRIADLALTATEVSRRAGIDPKTLRGLITGNRWSTAGVRARVESALSWPPGELLRLAALSHGSHSPLAAYTTVELLAELLHRATETDQELRMRPAESPAQAPPRFDRPRRHAQEDIQRYAGQ